MIPTSSISVAAAAAAVVAVSLFQTPAAARGGGFGHAGGMGGIGAASHSAVGGRAISLGGFSAGRAFSFRGDRFGFNHRPFFRNRLAFFAAYPYYNDCYARVWTPWGWNWTDVCY